jgi:hypothetical protein
MTIENILYGKTLFKDRDETYHQIYNTVGRINNIQRNLNQWNDSIDKHYNNRDRISLGNLYLPLRKMTVMIRDSVQEGKI